MWRPTREESRICNLTVSNAARRDASGAARPAGGPGPAARRRATRTARDWDQTLICVYPALCALFYNIDTLVTVLPAVQHSADSTVRDTCTFRSMMYVNVSFPTSDPCRPHVSLNLGRPRLRPTESLWAMVCVESFFHWNSVCYDRNQLVGTE